MPDVAPPVTRRVPVERVLHGETFVDDYAWLRDRDDAAVRAHIDTENAYTEGVLAPLAPLRGRLFAEIRSRVQEADASAPVPRGRWEYYTRTIDGQPYQLYCRRPRGGGAEQVLVDGNALGEGRPFFEVGVFEPSPAQRYLAYAVDCSGDEVFEMRFLDLATGTHLPDVLPRIHYSAAWVDDETILYLVPDMAWRPWEVWRHRLGTEPATDVLVHREEAAQFDLDLSRSRSGAYVFLDLESTNTTEVRYLPTSEPDGALRVLEPRRAGVKYEADHTGAFFYILTNDAAPNFRLVRAPVDAPGKDHWEEVLAEDRNARLANVDCFAAHLVLYDWHQALERLRVLDLGTGALTEISQTESVYSAAPYSNPEFGAEFLFAVSSPVTPPEVWAYAFDGGARRLLKRQPVPNYDSARFTTERIWAEAPDGERVPISLVRPVGVEPDGSAPAVLYAYGAYEATTEPTWWWKLTSYIEHGCVFAIAHPRGGGELGRRWYEAGRTRTKRNTFTDVIACAEHLVKEGWAAPDRLALRGKSAGGLMAGAVTMMRPDLFRAVLAEVPFVDVINTMLDSSIPLTTLEWEEWGDPADPAAYAYMRTYSPYENVHAREYPTILATSGLHDTRVQYFEPAKWIAALRATATGGGPFLLHTETGAGHSGPSGRYDAWRDEAYLSAFLLDALGAG